MLVKEASNVLKVVAQGASSVLTYVFSLTPLVTSLLPKRSAHEPVSPPVVVLALCVLFAALTFGLDSVHSKQGAEKLEQLAAALSEPMCSEVGRRQPQRAQELKGFICEESQCFVPKVRKQIGRMRAMKSEVPKGCASQILMRFIAFLSREHGL